MKKRKEKRREERNTSKVRSNARPASSRLGVHAVPYQYCSGQQLLVPILLQPRSDESSEFQHP